MAETGQDKRSVWGNRSIRDFSANVSPLGVPDGVRGDLPGGRENRPLSGSVMQKTGSKTFGGAFLSGRMDCLWQRGGRSDLSTVSGRKTEKVLLTAPAFAEYEQAAGLVGSRIYFYELKEEDQFQIQEDILGQITPDTDLVFLCEPNNPTGQCTKHSLLTAILERCRECSALCVG